MSTKEFLGSVVVKKGLASPEDILDCLKIQRRARQASNKQIPLGEIMVFKGLLSPSQLQEVLSEVDDETTNLQTEDVMLFQEVTMDKGFFSTEQLLECIDIQWKEDLAGETHRFIGDILKDKGYLDDKQYEEALELYEKSGTLSVVALKDNLRFKTDALDMNQEKMMGRGISYYRFPEKFRAGSYSITWYVQDEGGFKGPYTAEYLLKGNTAIAPVVDENGDGRVLYMQIS